MKKNILITGGAGFIGINVAEYYLKKGDNVFIFDNFSRKGSKDNIKYLKKNYKTSFYITQGDIRFDLKKLYNLVKKADYIFHFAGQVAVTTSVINPKEDFEINASGTLNLLEAVRISKSDPIVIYSSTNKVYGALESIKVKEKKSRYIFPTLPNGVSENFPLDPHSPYGCSKASADQYMHDYCRIYGIRTIVFRQSCIYGPHQFGIEDQGWVAWFLIALNANKDITIYGDGKQVRDILYIDDLIRAYDLAIKKINITSGKFYNIGGGVNNSISIWLELKPMLEKLLDREIKTKFEDIRPGDQKIFISDIDKAKQDFGWEPKINIEVGLGKLYSWINQNKTIFS